MKKIISLILVVLLAIGTTLPAMSTLAAGDVPVRINATAANRLTVEQGDLFPDGPDFGGDLYISPASFDIACGETDSFYVQVRNNTSRTISFYLTRRNGNSDLSVEFENGGSKTSPLRINPNRTENYRLTVNAENAHYGWHSLSVFATMVSGERELTVSKATLTIQCYGATSVVDFGGMIPNVRMAFVSYRFSSSAPWEVLDNVYGYWVGSSYSCGYYINNVSAVEEAYLYVVTDDCLYSAPLDPSQTSNHVYLDQNDLQKYVAGAGVNDEELLVTSMLVRCDKFPGVVVNFYFSDTPVEKVVYLAPNEYDITVNTVERSYAPGRAAAPSATSRNIKVNWAASYLNQDAIVYATGTSGAPVTKSGFKLGEALAVNADSYSVQTILKRNSSTYTVKSSVDTTRTDATINIGSTFNGSITNHFGTVTGGSAVWISLANLLDVSGNQLTSFRSSSPSDNLQGFVTFTNKTFPGHDFSQQVSLDTLTSFSVFVPADVAGEFTVSLTLFSGSELTEPTVPPTTVKATSLTLDMNERTLYCDQTAHLTATVLPKEAAATTKLVWSSSNSDLVSVDSNGKLKTAKLERGTAEITVKTLDGSLSAKCKVTVKFTFLQWIRWFLTGGPIKAIIARVKAGK